MVLKIGVVGVGAMGQHHARVYYELPNVELVGVADTDIEKANMIAKQYGCEAFNDYKKLFGKVDAVSIAVPTKLHKKITIDFLNKGMHVLVEKPMAVTIAEADEMIAVAKKNNRILMVGHIERFNPAIQELKKILSRDKIIQIEAHRYGPFIERAGGTGVILDLMTHDIDVVSYLTEFNPDKIYSIHRKVVAENPDLATSIIKLKNGAVVLLSACRATQKKVRDLVVICEDKYIELDYLTQEIDIYRKAEPSFIKGEYRQENIIEKIEVSKKEPLKEELNHFINCVQENKEPIVNGEIGRKNIELALKIMEAAE